MRKSRRCRRLFVTCRSRDYLRLRALFRAAFFLARVRAPLRADALRAALLRARVRAPFLAADLRPRFLAAAMMCLSTMKYHSHQHSDGTGESCIAS